MAKVFSYIRFSSKKQEQGDSVRRQVAAGEAWLKRHPEHALDTTLNMRDLGMSAFKGHNLDTKRGGALGLFIEEAKKPKGRIPKGSILMVERLDRLSRLEVMDALGVLHDLVRSGISVLTLEPEVMLDKKNINDIGIFFQVASNFIASHDAVKGTSDRLGDLWEARRKQAAPGHPISARCPAWLILDKQTKRFKISTSAKRAVTHIFKRTAEGCGQRQLTMEMNRLFAPIATTSRSTGWNGSYIQKILNDRSVLGEFQPYTQRNSENRRPVGEPITGYYPQIVSEELFYRASSAKARRKKMKGANGAFVNLFKGILQCTDGHSLQLQTTRSTRKNGQQYIQRRLVSYGHLRGLEGTCPFSFDYYRLEKAVVGILHGLDESVFGIPSDTDAEIAELDGSLEAIRSRLQELAKALEDETPVSQSTAIILGAIRNVQQKKDAMEKRQQHLRLTQPRVISVRLATTPNLLATIATFPPTEQLEKRLKVREAIHSIVERIDVDMIKYGRSVGASISVHLRSGSRRRLLRGIVCPPFPSNADVYEITDQHGLPLASKKKKHGGRRLNSAGSTGTSQNSSSAPRKRRSPSRPRKSTSTPRPRGAKGR